jgi:Holliday junction resolvase RusA-like endonuclease
MCEPAAAVTPEKSALLLGECNYDDGDAKPSAAAVTPEKSALLLGGGEKAFWSLPSDKATVTRSTEGCAVQFTVRGKPCALRRPGPRQYQSKTGGFRPFYNPSKEKQGVFKKTMLALLSPDIIANEVVLFPSKTPVSVKLVSFFERPKSHFVGSQPGGKLKSSAPMHAIGRADVDNLAKFVLDCLNGVVCHDDRQVVELYACKKYANEGATSVTVTSLEAREHNIV